MDKIKTEFKLNKKYWNKFKKILSRPAKKIKKLENINDEYRFENGIKFIEKERT